MLYYATGKRGLVSYIMRVGEGANVLYYAWGERALVCYIV